MSKSAGYCWAHLSHNTGLLLLCEVAAKPFYEQKWANYDADQGCKDADALYVLLSSRAAQLLTYMTAPRRVLAARSRAHGKTQATLSATPSSRAFTCLRDPLLTSRTRMHPSSTTRWVASV